MKIAVVRHGVGREGEKVLRNLENSIYKDLKDINDYEFEFFYLFREVKNENSIRNKEKNVTSKFSSLPFEKVINIHLPEKDFYINFKSFFTYDIHKDNFQSYRNLLNQTYMFRKFAEAIDMNQFSSFIVIRDDVIFLHYSNLKRLISYSQFGYVTSIWDWEGGVHDRFYMCSKDIFFELTFKYENLRNLSLRKKKINPISYSGEFLTLKILNNNNFVISPHNIKTQRIRQGYRFQKERHRIRIHDPFEVFNIIKSIILSRIIIFKLALKNLKAF